VSSRADLRGARGGGGANQPRRSGGRPGKSLTPAAGGPGAAPDRDARRAAFHGPRGVGPGAPAARLSSRARCCRRARARARAAPTPTPAPARSAASAVELVDAKLPEGFELLEGTTKASFAKVDVASKAEHSYTVKVTTAEGLQSFEPAAVSYKADADGEAQVRAGAGGGG
jgi:hypothetical protein